MANRFTTFIEYFTAGEISPLLRGRVDTPLPSHGFRRLENFYVIPQGGIRRREGTRHTALTKDSSTRSILAPYIINGTTAAILEIGNDYFRVFDAGTTEDGSVSDPGNSIPSSGSAGARILDDAVINGAFTTDITGWDLFNFSGSSITYDAGTLKIQTVTTNAYAEQTLPTLEAGEYVLHGTGTSTGSGGSFSIWYDDGVDDNLVAITNAFTASFDHSIVVTITDPAQTYRVRIAGQDSGATVNCDFIEFIAVPLEVTGTGISSAELQDIQLHQGPGGLYVTSEFAAPGLITRSDAGVWSYSIIPMTDGPYFDIGDATYGGVGSGTTVSSAGGAVDATITITSSAALFVATDVGRLIRVRPNDTSVWGYGEITVFNSTTSVDVLVKTTIAALSTTQQWRLGAWSATTGYPRASSFHEQRLVYGGTTAQQQTIWGSYVGQTDNFAPDDGSADENITALTAYTFTIASTRPELVQWLVSKDALLIGTNFQVHKAAASDFNEALNARNVNIKSLLKKGSARLDPAIVGDSIMFIQLYRRQLLEMYYNTNRGRHVARDLMIGADHLADIAPITSSGFQEFPYGLLYFGLENGELLALTYNPDENVAAWHRHILGGSFGVGNPIIESIVSVPGNEQDDVWMIVKRTVNGATTRTVEILSRAVSTNDGRTDMAYLDSYTQLNVVENGGLEFQNNEAGLPTYQQMVHLVGETVTIMVNDVLYGTDVVAAGGTLTTYTTPANFTPALVAADVVKVGLNYTSVAETNVIEPVNKLGHGPGSDSRIAELIVRLHNSLKGEVGYSSSALDDLTYPTSIDPTSVASLTYTGDSMVKFPHGWERDTRIYIQQTDPYPLTVTMLIIKMIGGTA